MRTVSIFAWIGLTTTLCSAAYAASDIATPDGVRGRHWEHATILLDAGRKAVITATNITTDAGQHNTSRIRIYVDGMLVRDRTVEAGEISEIWIIKQPGEHRITAICGNEHAAASSCTINAAEEEIQRIGG